LQAKAATNATPNYRADCGGCGRLRDFHINKKSFDYQPSKNKTNAKHTILPVGFAIDRLEGDGIKINSCFSIPLSLPLSCKKYLPLFIGWVKRLQATQGGWVVAIYT